MGEELSNFSICLEVLCKPVINCSAPHTFKKINFYYKNFQVNTKSSKKDITNPTQPSSSFKNYEYFASLVSSAFLLSSSSFFFFAGEFRSESFILSEHPTDILIKADSFMDTSQTSLRAAYEKCFWFYSRNLPWANKMLVPRPINLLIHNQEKQYVLCVRGWGVLTWSVLPVYFNLFALTQIH